MTEIRCKRCRRLLMKGEVKSVEIKCPKCGYIQMVEEGKKKLNRKLQSAASVRTMEDPESLLPLRQVITKNKEER
ncbi:MAG: Com family DNA-binding transcriptional regulator [Nitrospiraceae bacterium]|nr:MAG: Com family DNA-binding transcriptional regulator [Nitrospiraceae bacterium]